MRAFKGNQEWIITGWAEAGAYHLTARRGKGRKQLPEHRESCSCRERHVPFCRRCGPCREGTRGQNTPAFFSLPTLLSSANTHCLSQLHRRAGESGCCGEQGFIFLGARSGERVEGDVEGKVETVLRSDENRHHYRETFFMVQVKERGEINSDYIIMS